MTAYARRVFELGQKVEGSESTQREVYDVVAKRRGVDPSTLYKLPECPPECLYLLEWFCEVRGAEPLTFQEVEAWDGLRGVGVTPEEVKALMLLDKELQTVQAQKSPG